MPVHRPIAKTAEIFDHELSDGIFPFTYLVSRRLKHAHVLHAERISRTNWMVGRERLAVLFPSLLALLFVMFECRVEAANHFCGRFEQCLSFWLFDFVNVAPQMIDQLAKFFPNIRGMRARIL